MSLFLSQYMGFIFCGNMLLTSPSPYRSISLNGFTDQVLGMIDTRIVLINRFTVFFGMKTYNLCAQ